MPKLAEMTLFAHSPHVAFSSNSKGQTRVVPIFSLPGVCGEKPLSSDEFGGFGRATIELQPMATIEASGNDPLAGSQGIDLDEATIMSTKYNFILSCIGVVAILLVLGLASSCWDRGAGLPAVKPGGSTIRLTSPAFSEGGKIAREITCDGANKSPPLEWSGVPQAARSLVLICDDPDAPMGTFSHWVAYDLSPKITSREAGVEADTMAVLEPRVVVKQPRLGVTQGYNDFGKIGYGGPCPPSGVHHYVFRLYALDEQTRLPPGATRAAVFNAINGHILAEGHLTGTYGR